MDDDIRDLYRDMVMEHSRKPRNFRRLASPTCSAEGFNPLCGDQITLDVELKDDVISEVSFEGSGCAISRASASLMTEAVRGKSKAAAVDLFGAFRAMVTRGVGQEYDDDGLGDLEVLAGVTEFPVRIKCATLSWHTLKNALDGGVETAQTE